MVQRWTKMAHGVELSKKKPHRGDTHEIMKIEYYNGRGSLCNNSCNKAGLYFGTESESVMLREAQNVAILAVKIPISLLIPMVQYDPVKTRLSKTLAETERKNKSITMSRFRTRQSRQLLIAIGLFCLRFRQSSCH